MTSAEQPAQPSIDPSLAAGERQQLLAETAALAYGLVNNPRDYVGEKFDPQAGLRNHRNPAELFSRTPNPSLDLVVLPMNGSTDVFFAHHGDTDSQTLYMNKFNADPESGTVRTSFDLAVMAAQATTGKFPTLAIASRPYSVPDKWDAPRPADGSNPGQRFVFLYDGPDAQAPTDVLKYYRPPEEAAERLRELAWTWKNADDAKRAEIATTLQQLI